MLNEHLCSFPRAPGPHPQPVGNDAPGTHPSRTEPKRRGRPGAQTGLGLAVGDFTTPTPPSTSSEGMTGPSKPTPVPPSQKV